MRNFESDYDYDPRPTAAEVEFYERMATDPRFRAEVENPPEDFCLCTPHDTCDCCVDSGRYDAERVSMVRKNDVFGESQ